LGDLKSKALNSTFWSFVETFGNQGFQFVVGIMLARLLLPEDYGLIGVLAIFIGIAGVLVDSGFKTSIIRSEDLSDLDCSTIFFVNLFVSIITASLLFASANFMAIYFKKPELVNVTRVCALIPLINGFGLVQSSLLFKNLQFKRNAKISISSNVISGATAVFLAFKGFSYWALVWRAILAAGIYNLLLWINSSWHPKFIFSLQILKKHFRFSSRLLITNIFASVFDNIYSFVFGKFFSLKDLGFFTRGKGFVDLASKTISVATQKVNTSLLAASGNGDVYKINAYSKLLRATAFLVFPIIALLVAVAEPMIVSLIGEKWLPAVPYLRILAIAGMLYPILNSMSALFEVLGRSDIILKTAFIGGPVQIIILFITIKIGALMVAWGIVFYWVFILFLTLHFVSKVSNLKAFESLKVLIMPFSISILMCFVVYLTGLFLSLFFAHVIVFGIQTILGIFITILLFYLLKIKEFDFVKSYSQKLIKDLKVKFIKKEPIPF
jgi:O-antigen/teichoic acid export membrane protein